MERKQQDLFGFSFRYLFAILTLSIGISAQANPDLRARLERVLSRSKIPRDHLGLLLLDPDGNTVFAVNENRLFTPASITKLATTLAATQNHELGDQYKTQLLTTAHPHDGVLKGNLYFKGGGDPSFVSENMWYLVNIFSRVGITEIHGDIIADDTIFDKVRYDESREDIRVSRAYDAPVGGLSFNWNAVNVFVRPTTKGQKANVFADPENEYFEVENKVTTVGGAVKEVTVEKKSLGNGHEKLVVLGRIGEKAGEHVVYANVSFPDVWAGENLKAFLRQRGIKVTGKVRSDETPAGAEVVAEYASKPFGQILADMNKFSNNFVAEMLTKNLAADGKKPATLEAGVKKIRESLTRIGLKESQFKIINPSGLTLENKFTPTAFVRILQALKSDYRWRYDFYNSLPISGVDGTLKKRMKEEPDRGRVRAKTGLLTSVVSLAGFVNPDNGQEYIFSFMFNGGSDEAKVRAFYDELLHEVFISK